MNRVRSIVINSILSVVLFLLIMASVLVINDAHAVQADAAAVDQVVYLQLDNAPPVRDLAQQRLAPLE
ncbi:MAG: hypothetical protein FOGNACKC_02803 [Anaerolineae bacterium]|nr:hypothetical protein [Anaerolineae bacterium]